MKKVVKSTAIILVMFILSFVSIPANAIEMPSYNLAISTQNTPYKFAITPEDPKWKNITTTADMIAVTQIPNDVLKSMTTAALVNTILSNPFLTQFYAYDNSLDAMQIHIKDFNVFQELQNRPDYLKTLTDIYNMTPVVTTKELSITNKLDKNLFQSSYIEILLAAELNKKNDSVLKSGQDATLYSDIEKYRVAKKQLRDKEKSIYSSTSDGFLWFYKNLPNSAQNNVAKKTALSAIVLATTNATVRTPNGTSVSVLVRGDISTAEKNSINSTYDSMYPAATRSYTATTRFNCHSYAWYSTNTSTNNYWMNDPSAYWNDGSYTATGVAINRKVRYLNGQHSAIVQYYSMGVTRYISKWGAAGVYSHAPSYGPDYGYLNGIQCYTR